MSENSTQELDIQSFSLRQLLDLADSLQINCDGVETKAEIINLIKNQAENDSKYITQQSTAEELSSPRSSRTNSDIDTKPQPAWQKSKAKSQTTVFAKPPSSPSLSENHVLGNFNSKLFFLIISRQINSCRFASSCFKSNFT
jgi:uncharacterized protein YkwD